MPCETDTLIQMLKEGSTSFETIWGAGSFANTEGVKQGSGESPAVLGWLVDLIMAHLRAKHQCDGVWIKGCCLQRTAFMDDVITWTGFTADMQHHVTTLQSLLAKWGLKINITKSCMLCYGNTGSRVIKLNGEELHALPEGQPLGVTGTPIGPRVTTMDTLEAFRERARRCFRAKYDILHSCAPLKARLRILDRVVLATMTWAFGIIHGGIEITKALNALQVEMVISMAEWKRRSDEGFVDYQVRTQRMARAVIYSTERDRWGAVQLRLCWRYWGHVLRASQQPTLTCSGIMVAFRDLEWWANGQLLTSGERHGRRHYPRIMNQQRDIVRVAGPDWKRVSLNRATWSSLEKKWLQVRDVEWASGRQLQLTM